MQRVDLAALPKLVPTQHIKQLDQCSAKLLGSTPAVAVISACISPITRPTCTSDVLKVSRSGTSYP